MLCPPTLYSARRSSHIFTFRSYVASILSSNGIISSIIMTCLVAVNHIMMSGLSVVLKISFWNYNRFHRLSLICQSVAVAKIPVLFIVLFGASNGFTKLISLSVFARFYIFVIGSNTDLRASNALSYLDIYRSSV